MHKVMTASFLEGSASLQINSVQFWHNITIGSCCSFNSPPWFNVRLPNATTDGIEIRLGTDVI